MQKALDLKGPMNLWENLYKKSVSFYVVLELVWMFNFHVKRKSWFGHSAYWCKNGQSDQKCTKIVCDTCSIWMVPNNNGIATSSPILTFRNCCNWFIIAGAWISFKSDEICFTALSIFFFRSPQYENTRSLPSLISQPFWQN